MKKVVLIIAVILLGVNLSIYAQPLEMPVGYTTSRIDLNYRTDTFLDSINNNIEVYGNSPINKAADGIINSASAWVDIPKEINAETNDTNIFFGLTIGFTKGLITGFTRETAGVVDIVTCSFPPYDKPLMEPEYKVTKPEKEGWKLKILSW